MNSGYRVDWLYPADAGQIARLETKVYPPQQQSGRADIADFLHEAEAELGNVSAGLFHRTSLVGFILIARMRDRTRMCEHFDVELPPALDASAPVIYLSSLAVHAAHRRHTGLLMSRVADVVQSRGDLRGLTMETFATDEYHAYWKARRRLISHSGWRLREEHAFDDDTLERKMHWIVFEPYTRKPEDAAAPSSRLHDMADTRDATNPAISHRSSHTRLDLLEPQWDTLLAETAHASTLQSSAATVAWLTSGGFGSEPLIVVARTGRRPVAIAPLQISQVQWGPMMFRCLTFCSSTASAVAHLLGNTALATCAPLIADHVFSLRDQWDYCLLRGNDTDIDFLNAMADKARAADYSVTQLYSQGRIEIAVQDSWTNYLSSLPASVRVALGNPAADLAESAAIRLENADTDTMRSQAFTQYFELARRSRHGSSRQRLLSLRWLHALANQAEQNTQIAMWFLYLNDRPIAAMFAVVDRQELRILDFICGTGDAAHAPDWLILSRVLQEEFSRRRFDRITLTRSLLSGTAAWGSTANRSMLLHIHRKGWIGRLQRASLAIASLGPVAPNSLRAAATAM